MTRSARIAVGSTVVALALVTATAVVRTQGQMGSMAPKGQMACPMMGHMDGMEADGMAGGMGNAGGEAALAKVFAALGVTDAQKDKMKAVKEQHQAEIHDLTVRAEAAKLGLREAVESLVFDEALVRARTTALAGVMADGALAEMRIRAEAFKVLTADQQRKAVTVQKLTRELRDLLKSPSKK